MFLCFYQEHVSFVSYRKLEQSRRQVVNAEVSHSSIFKKQFREKKCAKQVTYNGNASNRKAVTRDLLVAHYCYKPKAVLLIIEIGKLTIYVYIYCR